MSQPFASNRLDAIQAAARKMDELESEFKQARDLLHAELLSTMRDLSSSVFRSDSQAEMLTALRFLYWNTGVSTLDIGEAFGIKERRVATVVGSLQVTINCPRCDVELQATYSSRHHRKAFDARCLACCKKMSEQQQREWKEQDEQRMREEAVYSAQCHADSGHMWTALENDPNADEITFFCNMANCDATIVRRVISDESKAKSAGD